MEKMQSTISTTYYDERKMFADIRWVLKQVLCSCREYIFCSGVVKFEINNFGNYNREYIFCSGVVKFEINNFGNYNSRKINYGIIFYN